MGLFLVVLGKAIAWAASIYTFILLARVILDWTRVLVPRWVPPGGLLVVIDWVYRLTEPPISWVRQYIQPIRLGTVAIDVGFIVVFVAVVILERVGNWLAYLGYVNL